MDPPRPSYFHQTRYAHQPPAPPPHHHPFPNNPNIYASHHSSLLAALPPPSLRPQAQQLPQPPLPSFRPVPSPQPFNSQNSQFNYNPNNFSPSNHPGSTQHPDFHKFTQSPRVLHQKPFDDELPRRLPDYIRENRSDLREPPRVLPDRWSTRSISHANLDPDSYRRQLDNHPFSPMKIRHDLESNSRFIEEHKQREELLLVRGDDNYHRRNQFGSTSDRTSRDFQVVSNRMNHSSLYENLRGFSYDGQLNENQRRVHEREVNEDMLDSFIDIGSNQIGDPDGIRVGSVKREHYRCREANAELERHNNKGSREGSYEFSRTPRKQQQKKSVLLRIQKPSYRNREDDRVHYSGYFDDSKSSFRGKDQNLYADHDMEEQVRVGSPVELDVSFKSNSLVAKAILTPASNSAGVSDSNLTPKNGKVRKLLVLNKDSACSSPLKPNEGTVKLDNASVTNYSAGSDDDLKQLKEEVPVSGTGDMLDSSSLPGSSRAKVSPAKSKLENSSADTLSNKKETNVVSGKAFSLKAGKKKKIVKRVVKKVVDPNLSSSISQRIKESNEPVIADGFVHGQPASSEPEKDAAIASFDIVNSQPCSSEMTVMPENDKVERFAKAMTLENGTSDNSGRLCVPGTKRKWNRSTSPLGSSSHEETKINDNITNGISANNMHLISETGKHYTKSIGENTIFDIHSVEEASQQLCRNRDLSLPENNAPSGSPKVLLSSECNASFGLLNPGKIKTPASLCNTTSGDGHKNCLVNSPRRNTVSDDQTTDVGCEQPFKSKGSPSGKNGIPDQFLNASLSAGSDEILLQSNSGELEIQNATTSASSSSEGVGTVISSDNSHTIAGEINFSSHGTSGYIHNQPSRDKFTTSLKDVSLGRSLSCMVSGGGSKENTPNLTESKKNVETPELDLSRPEGNDMYLEPVNMVRPGCWVDTTLRLSFKNPTPTEFTVSGDGCGNVGLQSCTDGVTSFPKKNSTDSGSINDVSSSGTSPQNTKKRKFSDSQLELTCPVASDVKEGPVTICTSVSGVEVPSNSCNGLMQSEAEARVSVLHPFSDSGPPYLQREITTSGDHPSGEGYRSTAASLKDAIGDGGLKGTHSCSAAVELEIPVVQSLCLSRFECEQIAGVTPVMPGSSPQKNSICIGCEVRKMNVDSEQAIVDGGTTKCVFPSELQSPDLDGMDVENDSCHHVKNDLPSVLNYLSSLRDGTGVSTPRSSNEVIGLVPDTLSDMNSLETLPDFPSTSHDQLSIEKVGGHDENILGKTATQGGSNISALTSGSPNTENNLNSDHGVENDHLFSRRIASLPSQASRNSTQILTTFNGEKYGRKNQLTHAVSRIYPGRPSFGFTAKSTPSSTHISKSRTWHRTDNSSTSASPGNKVISSTVPAQRQLPKKMTKLLGTSYIRKGNSLVRKPIPVTGQFQGSNILSSSVPRLNSLGTDEVKNDGPDTRTTVDPPNFVRTGGHASFERPRTPPLPSATKMPNHATNSFGDLISSSLAQPLHDCAAEIAPDPMTSPESKNVLKSSEDVIKNVENSMVQTGQINILDYNNETNDGNLVSSNVNSIKYVKQKLNQLVATSNPHSLSVNHAHNIPAIPSDSYYKRRKNQLIRTSLDNQVKVAVGMSDESVNSEGKSLHSISSSQSLNKRKLRKDVTKTRKPSKFSLVWTLRSSRLSNDDGGSLNRQKVLPHLFPWKRATYWRNFMPTSVVSSGNSSSSTIRKLLLLRKRDTVYTRSKHGFSLRKSKVLGVGGSSLKWSKSLERRSKKVNEEATLAVAEAERKKREQSDASRAISGTKNRNSSRKSVYCIELHQVGGDPGERIFRIGPVRYKMDSSRRTLQRISDDGSSNFAALQTEKDAKRSYVPRRLVIGKHEYVRIGNGNQLVRDPKKRTRILASEKVRWSLHTARSRLARKRKYCQFFTRFGKCNKDDGKCPYIHDPSKIAVCTKFLNGLCSSADCKLTHKVIPERMPDCSYFMQGLCTNKDCPYRHVHVNPNAPTCEGFLRGYCADGDECRKKHSYVCPTYEATGSCPQGSKCKLHHPKNRSKGKKSKQSREKKKAQGRYFGSMNINTSDPGPAVSEKHLVEDNDNIGSEGSIADYISLDFSGETAESTNIVEEQTSFRDSDPMEFELVDLDELIKPIRIMNT
ncbi:hypothetical protein JCGZ_12159 [Jatropha curcas]|uniref:C3H1-type domain-containing protein n=1 Tax=Jatropha curcas TaxID=180498 RepID=A0A067K9S4_JATCU|nr:uncharacterized protein At1g21580 isoform X2 [Jatropha curcas]KDP32867.1 hypothetical protein JCGZ_12159 [Jatropha curcas]